MRAPLLLVICVGACGGGGDAKPVTYTHADPAFAIDLPDGFTPTKRLDAFGNEALDFRGKSSALMITISWKPGGSPADARDHDRKILAATEQGKVVAEGELAGGVGVWMENDWLGGSVGAWMPAGDLLIDCEASTGGAHGGRDAVLAACKTLRPAP